MIRKIWDSFRHKWLARETIRYLIAGAATTLINFALFALMTRFIGIAITISNVTAISFSILFAYIVNKLFVFKRRSSSWGNVFPEFAKFVGARLFTMVLEVCAVELFVNVLDSYDLAGKAIAQILVIITNYFISKLIVFRKE